VGRSRRKKPQSTPAPAPRRPPASAPDIALGAAIVALTLLAYVPAIRGGFIWDDDLWITGNENLRSLGGLWKIWFAPLANPQYYPLVNTMYWVEYHLWGLDPLPYHLMNVSLHATSAVLLWRVLLRLAVPGAWLAAAVFALHPVQVESVAWITEGKNVLAGLFYLLALLAYLRFAPPERERPSGHRLFYALALGLFACALMAKTVTCTLPAALLLVLWWKRGEVRWRDLLPLVPLVAVGAAFGLATAWLEKHHVGAAGAQWSFSLVDRCLIAGRALCFYAGKLLWPDPLAFIYPRWQIDATSWWQYLFPLAALAVGAGLWIARRRLGRGPLVAVLFFAVTLGPALGFVDFFPMRFSFVADHFQYHASVGLIVLAVAAGAHAVERARRRQAGLVAATVVLAALATLTWRQGHVYKDLETLYRDTLAKNPDSSMVHNNLGQILDRQGKREDALRHYAEALRLSPELPEAHNNLGFVLEELGRSDEALAEYAEAVRLLPDYAQANFNLARLLAGHGKLDEAAAHYEESIRKRPRFALAHEYFAEVLLSLGRIDEAIARFREAVRLDPGRAPAHFALATALERQGELDEAIAQYEQTLRIDPKHAGRYRLGLALARQGRLDDAIVQYERVLRERPQFADAYNSLGLALARQDKLEEAVAQYEQALRIDPRHTLTHFNLGLALARLGRIQDARRHYQAAVDLDPSFQPARRALEDAPG